MNWKDLNQIVALLTIVGTGLGAYIYLDARHAHQEQVTVMELELMANMIDMDMDQDALVVNYYRQREIDSVREPQLALIGAEKLRYEYVQDELERKKVKKEMIEQKLMEMGKIRSID